MAVVVLIGVSAVLQTVFSPAAQGCSQSVPFVITPAQLSSGDLQRPGSALSANFRRQSSTPVPPVILGGYVIETVHTVEARGWTRGSVSTVVESWGVAPADLGPFVYESVKRGEWEDSCGGPFDGPALGTRTFHLVTSDDPQSDWSIRLEASDPAAAARALIDTFGEPALIERDEQAESLMIAELDSTSSGIGRWIAIAVGVVVVIGGALAYWDRRQQLFWRRHRINSQAGADPAA